jgi:response regulator RpfG family c-di-GMP phosphodiesterase
MPIPKELIDAIAERVADIILDRLADGPRTRDRLADGPEAPSLARGCVQPKSLNTSAGVESSCHERYDGQGYPDGLAGEEIPLIARIVCCCDAFNAMITNRPYRPAMTLAEARAELRQNGGTQFDPRVVDALVGLTLE